MKKCIKCGSELEDTSIFCSACGTIQTTVQEKGTISEKEDNIDGNEACFRESPGQKKPSRGILFLLKRGIAWYLLVASLGGGIGVITNAPLAGILLLLSAVAVCPFVLKRIKWRYRFLIYIILMSAGCWALTCQVGAI